jgi:methylmalonyl-CoA mutase
MRPDFKNIDFRKHSPSKVAVGGIPVISEWMTAEQINVKSLFTREDLADLEHLDYAAGIPPFLRGPYSTMYVMQPWTIRQY